MSDNDPIRRGDALDIVMQFDDGEGAQGQFPDVNQAVEEIADRITALPTAPAPAAQDEGVVIAEGKLLNGAVIGDSGGLLVDTQAYAYLQLMKFTDGQRVRVTVTKVGK